MINNLNKDLSNFIESNNIPNIIFYGDNLTCKKSIMYLFLKSIIFRKKNFTMSRFLVLSIVLEK